MTFIVQCKVWALCFRSRSRPNQSLLRRNDCLLPDVHLHHRLGFRLRSRKASQQIFLPKQLINPFKYYMQSQANFDIFIILMILLFLFGYFFFKFYDQSFWWDGYWKRVFCFSVWCSSPTKASSASWTWNQRPISSTRFSFYFWALPVDCFVTSGR